MLKSLKTLFFAVMSALLILAVGQVSAQLPNHDMVPTLVKSWGSHGSNDGQFSNPVGVATDSLGNVYVTDYNQRIQKFTSDGSFITKWGSNGTGDGQFFYPRKIAVDSLNNVYVADYLNERIQKFTSDGTFITKWGSNGTGDGQFSAISGITTDSSGNVYVADYLNERIQKFTSDGSFITKWGSNGTGDSRLISPQGIATDSSGNVYVLDGWVNSTIKIFTGDGLFLKKWNSAIFSNDKTSQLRNIAVSSTGDVYIDDIALDYVEKYTKNGVLISHWGHHDLGGGIFQIAQGIATYSENVYVAEENNARVDKFSYSSQTSPPFQQIKNGILPENVKCNEGLELIIKTSDGSPACVKPQIAQILVERGWGVMSLIPR